LKFTADGRVVSGRVVWNFVIQALHNENITVYGEGQQIWEIAELVIELTGSSSKIVCHPLPQDDPKQRCPDISLAKSVLGWQPQIQLREGLKRTIDYFDLLLREKKA